MPQPFDVIILGLGSMGSAAACHLAKRGHRVLGLEQFAIPHGQGSHGGFSRMIRLAYFEHPDYVALLRRAYTLWDELERESGQKLLHITGGLYLGRPDSELVLGSIEAAKKYNLPHEVLSRDELARRFPLFNVPDDSIAFHETQAGFLVPEAVVSTQVELALRHGAVLHGHERVTEWKADAKGVSVTTDRATYHAQRLIITAGAWSSQVLRDLGVKLKVTRQALAWFWPRDKSALDGLALGRFPSWALDLSPREKFRGVHYGFPMLPPGMGNPGIKAALHWPDEACDPETVDRNPRPSDEAEVRSALVKHIPAAAGDLLALRTCLYTNSPDGHFIVDQHPPTFAGADRVTIACGFSGHGFKFVSVMGEALADLATEGKSANPIGFLGLKRFA
ncbi:MAG: N-methyl-L-tryptophan oxidase [Phycisphaeraceae bacterium]